jgi:hypothetical protein
MIRTLVLVSCRCLRLITNPTPPPSTWLHHAPTFDHVGEYVWITRALTLNTSATSFDETMWIFCLFHSLAEVDPPPFCQWFPSWDGGYLNRKAFIFALAYSPCLSSSGLLSMVYEFLQDYFVLDDFVSGFNLFFEICGHIVWSHVPLLILRLFFAFWFLMLKNQFWTYVPLQ